MFCGKTCFGVLQLCCNIDTLPYYAWSFLLVSCQLDFLLLLFSYAHFRMLLHCFGELPGDQDHPHVFMEMLQRKELGLIFSYSFLVFGWICWNRLVHGQGWWSISWDVALQSFVAWGMGCTQKNELGELCGQGNWSQCWWQQVGCAVLCCLPGLLCQS